MPHRGPKPFRSLVVPCPAPSETTTSFAATSRFFQRTISDVLRAQPCCCRSPLTRSRIRRRLYAIHRIPRKCVATRASKLSTSLHVQHNYTTTVHTLRLAIHAPRLLPFPSSSGCHRKPILGQMQTPDLGSDILALHRGPARSGCDIGGATARELFVVTL